MENEDNLTDGVLKTRPVLTDVTNLPAKRPLSSISGDGEDSHFTKQVCSGVENLVKKKCQLQLGAQTHHNNNDNVLLQPKGQKQNPSLKSPFCGDTSLQNVSSQEPNLPSDGSEEQKLLGSVGFGEKGDDRDRDLCVVDNSGSPKYVGGSVELPTSSASRDFKFPGLQRCSVLKGDGVAGGDILKTCTCSFCSKAAYIWSDLHYQDVKGRLSALKKSQKEASLVMQKFSTLKDTVIHDPQSDTESSKLEMSLMHQWKSLFAHMENTFAQEIRQLESSFETLKDLRENCKNDLELTDNSHFDNH